MDLDGNGVNFIAKTGLLFTDGDCNIPIYFRCVTFIQLNVLSSTRFILIANLLVCKHPLINCPPRKKYCCFTLMFVHFSLCKIRLTSGNIPQKGPRENTKLRGRSSATIST